MWTASLKACSGVVPQRPRERRAQVVVVGLETVERDERPSCHALGIGRLGELEVEGEMARLHALASPASARRSRAYWRIDSSSR